MTKNSIIKRKKKITIGTILTYAVLLVYTLFLFLPFASVVVTSFLPTAEIATAKTFLWWSKNASFDAYKVVFAVDKYKELTGLPGLLLGFINTMWMTLIPLGVGMFVSGLSAFAFSKMDFPHKEGLFRVMVLLSMIPLGAFGLISYVFYSGIGWTEELGFLPLIVPGMFGSIGMVFFLRMQFDGIPMSVIEAAQLDGADFFQTFFKVMAPMAKPAFMAQFILNFVAGYNNYMQPMLYLQNQPKFVTLQLYLSQVTTLFPNVGNENIHCAAAIMGMLPLILIYCFLQRFFIEGVSSGSVKE